MSKLLYIAGNYPLKEVIAHNVNSLSIKESLACEVQDRDMLLSDDLFSISPLEKSEDILTQKTYCASLDWKYTKGRAARVAAYVKDYLQHTDEVEIWNIWMGTSYPPPLIQKKEISADELTPELLEKIDGIKCYEKPALYKKHVPAEWNISQEEFYPETHYCFVIRARR